MLDGRLQRPQSTARGLLRLRPGGWTIRESSHGLLRLIRRASKGRTWSVPPFATPPIFARRNGELHNRDRRILQHPSPSGDDRWAVGQHASAGEEPAHDLAGQGQAAQLSFAVCSPRISVSTVQDFEEKLGSPINKQYHFHAAVHRGREEFLREFL